jgi:ATP-binding cassette subfamily B protein
LIRAAHGAGNLAVYSAAKSQLRPLASLLPYVKRYRWRAISRLGGLDPCGADDAGRADRGAPDDRFRLHRARLALIDSYFLVMIGVGAVLAFASALRYYLVTTLGERIVADLRGDVFAHLTSLSAAFFDEARTGEVISRLTADTTQIKAAVGSSVSVALRNLVLFIGASAMMVVTSPRLSAFVLAAIPIIVLPLYAFGRAVRRRSRFAQDTLADASAYAAELIGAVRVLQAFTNERLGIARFRGAVERAFAAARDSIRARASSPAMPFSGLHQRRRRAVDRRAGRAGRSDHAGRLGQFVLYAVFRAGALGSLSEIGGESRRLPAPPSGCSRFSRQAGDRAPAQPLALPVPPRGESLSTTCASPIRRAGLSRRSTAFRFACGQGEKVAIVGPSGAGKSTIFHLLLRFYDPAAGTITFDGVPLGRSRSGEFARAHRAGAAGQRDVRRVGAREYPLRPARRFRCRGRARRRARACAEFIAALPKGFDTPVGERGVTLSGGQRQRIAIARAILRDAPLLLLDEATSSLDAESETQVAAALAELMRERTTHRHRASAGDRAVLRPHPGAG